MSATHAPEFAIVGAGAIGSILGAHLARAGHRVTMYARGARLECIARDGLRIRGLAEFTTLVAASGTPEQLRSADALILATKAIDTRATLARFSGAAIGAAFSIQNGVLKNELLAATFGAERVLGALANTSGELEPDGTVLFTRNVSLLLGAPGPSADPREPRVARAAELATAIDAAGVRAAATPDIATLEWSKFVAWVGLAAAALVTRAPSWRYLSDPGAALLVVRLAREMAAVARAEGVALSDDSVLPVRTLVSAAEGDAVDLVLRIGADYRVRSPEHRISALQDLLAGRPLELAETVGDAVHRADSHALDTPLLRSFGPLLDAVARTRAP